MSELLSQQDLTDALRSSDKSADKGVEEKHWSTEASVHAWANDHQGLASQAQNLAHDYFGTPTLFGESEKQAVREAHKLSGMPVSEIFKMSSADIKGISAMDLAGVPIDKREELLFFSGMNSGAHGQLWNQLSPQERQDLRRSVAE